MDGVGSYQGRVEVCHNNAWGTVCDDFWNRNDGMVACRQLGLRFVNTVGEAFFGRGTGPIWLDDLICAGSESRLIDCAHNGFGLHNCGHSEDAGLLCEGNWSMLIMLIHMNNMHTYIIYVCITTMFHFCTLKKE